MVLKISSKFELRRFCRTIGDVSLVSLLAFDNSLECISELILILTIHPIFVKQLKLSQPNPEDLGYVDFISVEEIGGARVLNMLHFSPL